MSRHSVTVTTGERCQCDGLALFGYEGHAVFGNDSTNEHGVFEPSNGLLVKRVQGWPVVGHGDSSGANRTSLYYPVCQIGAIVLYTKDMIVGIDEVGRGAWAGPMAVGAVMLGGSDIAGLTDSKKLTKIQRERLALEIRQKAAAVGIGWVSAKTIDQIGLSAALKLAAARALAQIRAEYREIIIDGTMKLIDDPRVTLMKKADLLVPSVSAASIVAKVARDHYMYHLDSVFPGYKFTGHVGYGTAAHREAIAALGASPVHRLSYEPLKQYRPQSIAQTTKQIGDKAEALVEMYLKKLGHAILARNWRTKYCEIDIVSQAGDTVFFTEVKYRKNANHGGAVMAVNAQKQERMAFAAELFIARHNITANPRLAVAAVEGEPLNVVSYLELL